MEVNSIKHKLQKDKVSCPYPNGISFCVYLVRNNIFLSRLDSILSQSPLDLEAAEKQCDEAVKEVHTDILVDLEVLTQFKQCTANLKFFVS